MSRLTARAAFAILFAYLIAPVAGAEDVRELKFMIRGQDVTRLTLAALTAQTKPQKLEVFEFTKHEAYLAIAVPGANDFSVFSKIHGNQPVELGPFYLVWKNVGDAVLMAQGPNFWPYQLTTVDLVRFADKAAKLAPPAQA